MIGFRKEYTDIFAYSSFTRTLIDVKGILAYQRNDSIIVLNNFNNEKIELDININQVLFYNYYRYKVENNKIVLNPF